ncbi:tripartite tricarboxylate transporter TctB family protein [Roseovarius sp.]|uniref:tripartite tricarboxylate transporter TctB family protein n=1 Tax=Roseovarius sp. TaxID=1486281 RepID=UPI003A96DB10
MSDTPKSSFDRTALIESLVVMALAAVLYGVTYTFEKVPPFLAQGIQPTVFPRVILILMFGLAVIQAVKALRLTPADLAALKPPNSVPPIVFLTAALLIALPILMSLIGTFPTLVIFMPALAFLWGERRWILMALSFAGFIGFVYALFRLTMNVPLP